MARHLRWGPGAPPRMPEKPMFPPVSFRIQTQWSFTARIAEVADILGAPEDFPR